MDFTPGRVVRDSRSLSADAARFDAEANDTEAQLRDLEAKIKEKRALLEKSRLLKQQAEVAREAAFQNERTARQSAVRGSINDHHIEGIRRFLSSSQDQNLFRNLQTVAAGGVEASPMAAVIVNAIILLELIGDERQFIAEIAEKVLKQANVAEVIPIVPEQTRIDNGSPKMHTATTATLASPPPTRESHGSPKAYESPKRDDFAHEDNNTVEAQAVVPPAQAVVESYQQESTTVSNRDDAPDIVQSVESGAEGDHLVNGTGTSVTVEQVQGTSINDEGLSTFMRLKQETTDGMEYSDNEPTPTLARFQLPAPTPLEGEVPSSQPQTPQSNPLYVHIPAKTGLNSPFQPSTAGTKTPGKRKRQDSQSSTPASEELGETPLTKKGRKTTDDSAVVGRVAEFLKKVKTLTPADQAVAVRCCLCGNALVSPRIAHCLHLFCKGCFGSAAHRSKEPNFKRKPCTREGCDGVLGRPTIVKSDVWTGLIKTELPALDQGQHENSDAEDDNSLEVV